MTHSKKPNPSDGSKFDWAYWQYRYVTGDDYVTLESLSKLHGAPAAQTLRKRAATEDWAAERRKFRNKASTQSLEVAGTDLAEVKARHLAFGKALTGTGLNILNDLRRDGFKRATVRDAVKLVEVGAALELRALGLDALDPWIRDLSEADLEKMSLEELEAAIERLDRTLNPRKQQRAWSKN